MRSIVIYYSRADENYFKDGLKIIDKGNTEIVAEKLAKLVRGKLFKIEPVNNYPIKYNECCTVAKDELSLNMRPKLKNKLFDLDEYDTVYIGGPIWWNHYPMPIFSLLEDIDFTGKTVKYFDTHEGSGLGHILEDIEYLCKNATIKDGLAIQGQYVNDCDELLKEWIKK